MEYQERLSWVIPGGAHTYSRGRDQFPSNAPAVLAGGKGARVWDTSGNTFLDYGMGLRSVTLGYSDERVNAGAITQIELGNSLTRPSLVELEAAERLVDLIPAAEMVKFAKNGSAATTAAIKLARAYTGKSFVAVPRQHPFFSYDDWFIGSTVMNRGVAREARGTAEHFDYGDIDSLAAVFDKMEDDVACVILEPATSVSPCRAECGDPGSEPRCSDCPRHRAQFLVQVQQLCRSRGALFILDEMITGFRWHRRGAAHYFGVHPDLLTFGKAMANGFSVAAVCGRREIMELGAIERPGQERVFLMSSTHGAEMSGLGAFMATQDVYDEEDVVGHLWNFGKRLRSGLKDAARTASADNYFHLTGASIALDYLILDSNGSSSLPLRTLFNQELIRNQVLMPWIAPSLAHDSLALEQTLEAVALALAKVRQAAEGDISEFLVGDAIKPVFRSHN